MINLKQVEWHGGASAHRERGSARPTQRELVAASLLRSGEAGVRRWDETTHVEYRDRRAERR